MNSIKLFFVVFVCLLSITSLQAQKTNLANYLDQLPQNLILNNSIIRSYQITTDYMDYDLKGNFLRKTSVTGDYTSGIKGDSVKWKNVYVSSLNDLGKPFSKKINGVRHKAFVMGSSMIQSLRDLEDVA